MNLVKKEMIQDDISIQDVIFTPPGKWFLNFYRPEDALKVLKYFNGFSFRGHILAVRFCYPDGTVHRENYSNSTSHNFSLEMKTHLLNWSNAAIM